MKSTSAVDEFVAGIEAARIPVEIYCDDVVLDATVPNWRYSVRGAGAVQTELSKWYAEPGRFEDVRRTALADGELVELTLRWDEKGVAHMCHQAHILKLRDGQISKDTIWCGGRWPAALLAEMEAAQQASGATTSP